VGKVFVWVIVIIAILFVMRIIAHNKANAEKRDRDSRNGRGPASGPSSGSSASSSSGSANRGGWFSRRKPGVGDDAGRAQQWPRSGAQPPGKTGQPTAGRAVSESMVRCEYCGIHLPRSEALLLQGKTWCGEEHARLGGAQVKS